MSRRRHNAEPPAFDIMEEAAHALRSAPPAALAAYLFGAVPFVVGVLFFAADMSRGAFATRYAGEAALGVTFLFVWMRTWQAVAAEQVLAIAEHREAAKLGWRAWLDTALGQARIQGFSLIVLPVCAVLALPFGWAFAYYQSACIFGARGFGVRLHDEALEQARLWPKQNHLILIVLVLVALLAFVNVCIALYVVPSIIRSLTGADQVLPTTGWNPLNTTFLGAAIMLTYLLVDPFVKAVYLVRCFHGRSQRTGIDLLVQVRAAARMLPGVAAMLVAVFCATASLRADESGAATDDVSSAISPVPADDLDLAIDEVIERPEFSWRLPRELADETDLTDDGPITAFFKSIGRSIGGALRWFGRMVEKILDWLGGSDDGVPIGREIGAAPGLATMLHLLLVTLVVVLVLVLVWLLVQWLRRSEPEIAAIKPASMAVELEREDLTADQLPEDEWMRLARDLLARGETRLALRALFLGSLAALSARGLIVLARHKSNRDYERELLRRGSALGDVPDTFVENRRLFERVWYGRHVVAPQDVERFTENTSRMAQGGEA